MDSKSKNDEGISDKFFDILACPVCGSELKLSQDRKFLICTKCKEEYPIKDGFPVLIPENER